MDRNLQDHLVSSQSTALYSSGYGPGSASASASASTGPHETDASSADAKASKRVRTSRPKVKTGCSNCKQRRIKCDEKRPACANCERSKKECTGYPPPSRSARPFEEIRIAPKPGQAPLLAAAPAPLLAAAPTSQQQAALGLLHSTPPYHRHLHQSAQLAPRRAQKLSQRRNNPSGTVFNGPMALAVAAATASHLLYNPSIKLPFSQGEGQYFKLFQTQTASELSGFFDGVFWSKSVLMECHSEAAIRHAVVALGALYKTLEKTTESPPTSPSGRPYENNRDGAYRHWEVALNQYSSACTALYALVGEDPRTQRTRLMASVLLACFDSFIGDHKQAIIQIQTGLRLLDRVRTEHRRSRGSSTSSEPIEDELTQMFARLAIQAKSYDMAFHFPQPYVIRLLPESTAQAAPPASAPGGSDGSPPVATAPPSIGSRVLMHQDPIPAQFVSLRQARLSWDILCELIFRSMEYMFQNANGPPNLLPQHLSAQGNVFQTRIEAWSNAFEPLLRNRAAPGVNSQEKAGIAVLKMFQIMALILCLMTFSNSEMMFDGFQSHFAVIVELADEVVGDEERRAEAARCPDSSRCVHRYHENGHGTHAHSADFSSDYRKGFKRPPSHIKASFSADLGIVPPLFVVATKSRDRVLRRQAIQLLRSSARREGMWDSELVARIAMWVVEIEEEGEEEEFLKSLQEHRASMASAGSFGSFGSYERLGSIGSIGSFGSGPDPNANMVDVANLPSPASSMSSTHAQAPYTSTTPSGSPGGYSGYAGTPSPSPHAHAQSQSQSQSQSHSSVSESSGQQAAASVAGLDYSDAPLGPGGNARWDELRAMQATVLHTTSMRNPQWSSGPVNEALPYYMQIQRPVSAEKRILVKSCEFDLREHKATLKCGTRGLAAGRHDMKTRETKIRW